MSRIKQFRRKLGRFYWEYNGKIKTWWYFRKKNWNRFGDWIRGWVYSDQNREKNQAKCLVICAHPDDETLYFSSILKNKDAFVICMSGRGSRCRSAEFYEALKRQGSRGMLLNMPDVPYMTWVWKLFAPMRLRRLARCYQAVKIVYTHSCSGESHHPHHYATGMAVDKVFSRCEIFKTAIEMPVDGKGTLSAEDRAQKLSVLRECYPSQIKMLETWYPWWQDYLGTEHFGE